MSLPPWAHSGHSADTAIRLRLTLSDTLRLSIDALRKVHSITLSAVPSKHAALRKSRRNFYLQIECPTKRYM